MVVAMSFVQTCTICMLHVEDVQGSVPSNFTDDVA